MCDEFLHRIRHKYNFFREQVIVIKSIKELILVELTCLSLGSQRHANKPRLEGVEPRSQFQIPPLYYDLILYYIILYYIFVNCNWVASRWQ